MRDATGCVYYACPIWPSLLFLCFLVHLKDPLAQSQWVISNNLQFLSLSSFLSLQFLHLSFCSLDQFPVLFIFPHHPLIRVIHPTTQIPVSGPWRNCGTYQLLDIFCNLAFRSLLLLCWGLCSPLLSHNMWLKSIYCCEGQHYLDSLGTGCRCIFFLSLHRIAQRWSGTNQPRKSVLVWLTTVHNIAPQEETILVRMTVCRKILKNIWKEF